MPVAIIVFGKHSASTIAKILLSLNESFVFLDPEDVPNESISHVIFSGGHKDRYEDNYIFPEWLKNSEGISQFHRNLKISEGISQSSKNTNIPILGISHGALVLNKYLGGKNELLKEKQEEVISIMEINEKKQEERRVFVSSYEKIVDVAKEIYVLGVDKDNNIRCFTDNKRYWGYNYSPESLKERNLEVFRNFLNI